jgi:hypothetical protein
LLEVKYLRVGFINQSISRSKSVPFRDNGVTLQQKLEGTNDNVRARDKKVND